jgi:Cupin superfamily protein
MNMFDTLIAQWGGAACFQSALGARRLHGRIPPEQAQSLINWSALDELIANRRLVPPDLQVLRDGRAVGAARYVDGRPSRHGPRPAAVDPARLRDCLGGGGTLVVNSVHSMLAGLGESAADLSRAVGEGTYINLYATWGQTRGFDDHWDDHDVVVVQVHGEKSWHVYGPGTRAPVDRRTDAANQRPVAAQWSGILRPGDVLYLPRGWWHAVRGTGPGCLHLTYGFERRTGLTYLDWLLGQARREMPFRVDVPRGDGARDLDRHQEALAECIVQLMRRQPLQAYLQDYAASLAAPPALGLADLSVAAAASGHACGRSEPESG